MFVAIGLFFSALTTNLIIAAIWTFLALLQPVILPLLAYSFAAERTCGRGAAAALGGTSGGAGRTWLLTRVTGPTAGAGNDLVAEDLARRLALWSELSSRERGNAT